MREVRKPLAKALGKVTGAREPSFDLGPIVKGAKASERAPYAKVPKAQERARKKRVKKAVHAKARERLSLGGGFKGTYTRKGLMPLWAEALANAPDGPMPRPQPECVRNVLLGQGWVEDISGMVLRHDRPVINRYSGWLPKAPRSYALTEKGKVVRAWLQWVRARRVMGWPCPMFGKGGAYVDSWIRGEDVPRKRAVRVASTGYMPGDVADEAWPGFTGWPDTAESGLSGRVVNEKPD